MRRRQLELFDDEQRARAAYRSQKSRAKFRGIEFIFNFRDWWRWWQRGGRWARRGRGMGKLVMARHGDRGAYAPDNVYLSTFDDNSRFARPQESLDL